MYRANYLKKSLKLEEYFDGVDRILRFLSAEQFEDEFLMAKASELQVVDAALFALVGAQKEVAMGIREKSNRLTNEVTSLSLLLKSLAKSNQSQRESVAYLQAILDRYSVFSRKNTARKIADAKALVRDFGVAEAVNHVNSLDGVHQQVNNISLAIDALMAQQDALAAAVANPAAKSQLLKLKDEAKLIVNAIGDCLKGLSITHPEQYADSFNLFCAIIDSANQPSGQGRVSASDEDEEGLRKVDGTSGENLVVSTAG